MRKVAGFVNGLEKRRRGWNVRQQGSRTNKIANFRAEWAPPAPTFQAVPLDPNAPTVYFDVTWSRLEVGWDVAARAYSRAMKLAGVDMRLSRPPNHLAPEVAHEVGSLVIPTVRADIFMVSSCFATASKMHAPVDRLMRSSVGRRVLYTMFERSNFDRSIVSMLAPLDAVFVPCSANREALEALGLTNVVSIPVPHFEDEPLLRLPRPREARVFYWLGNWSPRKAPDNLVRAFMRAFHPGEAELALYTGPSRFHRGWPEPEAIVSEGLGKNGWTEENWRGSIRVDRKYRSRADVVSEVHGSGDVYVSASRGEGYDMPAYEAKLAGRRIVTTDSGGPRDFLGEHDVLVPATGLVPVHPDYIALFAWEHGSTYADYSLDALVAALQKVRSEPVNIGIDWPIERFTGQAVGERLRAWALSLCDRLKSQ